MRRRYVLAGIGALAAVVALWFFLSRPSAEKQIRATLARLSAAVSVDDEDTNPLVRRSRINSEFKEIFDPQVSVSIQEITLPSPGRAGLVELASQASMYLRALDVSFGSVVVRFDPPKQSAQVKIVATIRMTSRQAKPQADTRDVDLFFVKTDGWRIASVTVWEKKE